MSWKVRVIAGGLICVACPLIIYLFFIDRTDSCPVEEGSVRTSNSKEDNSSSEANHAATSDRKPAVSSEPIRNVSPTFGLARMIEVYEQDVFEDSKQAAEISKIR
ncbi:MAG: hypothetical protein JSW47_20645, partial [Phycisphaerales bacterium]